MNLQVLPCGPIQANCYILSDENTHNCVIIDPGDAETVLNAVRENKYSIKKILLTHGHFDHCMGVSAIQEQTACEVYIHEADAELVNGESHYLSAMQYGLPPFNPSHLLKNDDDIEMDSVHLKALHTPGHSKGGVCFIDAENSRVFSGDTLFCESIGRTDLHGGSMNELAHSVLNLLFALPDTYKVYPGHGEPTSISHEKVNNPLVRYADFFKQQLS